MKDLSSDQSNTDHSTSSMGDTSLTDKFSKTAHEAIDRASEKAALAEQSIRSSAERTEAQAHALAESADRKSKDALQTVQAYAREHPIESLGIAFASGLLLSRLLRR